jgi:hypothetical protein
MLVGKVTTKEGGGSLAGSVAALTEKSSSVAVAVSEVIVTLMNGRRSSKSANTNRGRKWSSQPRSLLRRTDARHQFRLSSRGNDARWCH